jgi:hypothetical protein
MSNQQKDNQDPSAIDKGAVSRSDTTASAGAQPVQGQSGKVGSDIAGAAGSDAAAGAKMGGDGGHGPRGQPDAGSLDGSNGAALGDQLSPATGAAVAGGTGLGTAANADDTRDSSTSSAAPGSASVPGDAATVQHPGA